MTTPNGAGSPPAGGRGYGQVYELATITPPAQANPDMWANAEAARFGFFGNILSGFISIGAAIGQALEDLAAALFGNYDGSHPGLVAISDGMTALNGRMDLLDDVPGYAGAFMSTNRRFGAGSAFKTIPFDTPYGPEKKAHLDLATHRMVLDTGSWSVHFTIVTAAGAGFGGVGHSVRALVRDAQGNAKISRIFDWQADSPEWAQHYAMPVIATEDGWTVEIGYRHNGTWWPMSGGTEKTLLWVERKNIDTDNATVISNPPNGPDVT